MHFHSGGRFGTIGAVIAAYSSCEIQNSPRPIGLTNSATATMGRAVAFEGKTMRTVLHVVVPVAAIGVLVPLFGASAQAQNGACCLANANCLVLGEAQCGLIDGGNWAGPGTDCTDFEEIGTADACETRVPKLYWLSGGRLRRANLDGTEVEEMGSADAAFIDWPTGKLYVGGSGIRRLELNGDLVFSPTGEALVTVPLTDAAAIWVDHAGQKLYWAGREGMFRAGLDIPKGETADNRTDIERVTDGRAIWLAIIAPSDDCGRTTADSNHDGDIDLRDFAVFQNCLSGPTQ